MNRKVMIRIVILLAGAGVAFISLFAYRLGLDNDPGWGGGRLRILVLGLLIILFGSAYWIVPAMQRIPFIAKWSVLFEADGLDEIPLSSKARSSFMDILLALAGIMAIWVYIWVISVGSFDKFPSGRDYYGLLARAFQMGQTHLLVEPGSDLLNLENPYDYKQRKDLDYLWDVTLYNGKYYLYWGPIPAVLGSIFSSATSIPVTDAGLVFTFVAGSALFSVLLLRAIKREYAYPDWLYGGAALVLLVNIPLVWMLTRPKFYEVSAAGGMFFMMAGFYFLFLAFRSTPLSNFLLALAALSFGLAVGSRINLAPAIFFLGLVMLWRIYSLRGERLSDSLSAFLSVVIPLLAVAASLAWYNYIRFGSILEFGHHYQLTGASVTPIFNDTMSLDYVLPNLYNYFLRFPNISAEFPFVTLGWIREDMWPSFIQPPAGYYYTDPVGGLPFIVPLIGLVILLGLRSLWRSLNGDVEIRTSDSAGWLTFALLGYCLIQTIVLLMYITSNMRYLVDIAQETILLLVVFAGSYMRTFAINRFQKKVVGMIWVLASALTVIMGLLIGITGDKNNFLNQNPQVYYQLLEWFSR